MKKYSSSVIAGVSVGLIAVCLAVYGNPANMAFCIACFIRDIAGALGLHRAEAVQYIRPEIIGIVLGALIIAVAQKDFAPKGGSSPLTRFILGICVMVGALIFLGCPLRMVLRIAGGDLNAIIGLIGFAGGIFTGVFFLNKGFSLRRAYDQSLTEGTGISLASVLLLGLLVAAPTFLFFSTSGPGSLHAPLALALAAGLGVGIIAQRSRLCFIGGIRDAIMFSDFKMLSGFVAILITVLIGNIAMGTFKLSFEGQPVAHMEMIWNVLGLYLVGFGSVLLGGCPLRQLVLAGSGNSDSAITVLGFLVGAAFCHNFGLASSGAGTTENGRIAFFICTAIVFAIAYLNLRKTAKA